jgi:hypothetical protein
MYLCNYSILPVLDLVLFPKIPDYEAAKEEKNRIWLFCVLGSLPERQRPQDEKGKSIETGRERVKGVRDRREYKDGWLFEYRGKDIFTSDDYWTKASSSGKTIWLLDKLSRGCGTL